MQKSTLFLVWHYKRVYSIRTSKFIRANWFASKVKEGSRHCVKCKKDSKQFFVENLMQWKSFCNFLWFWTLYWIHTSHWKHISHLNLRKSYKYRSDYFKVLTLWPQIKCWSTYSRGSVAATPKNPRKTILSENKTLWLRHCHDRSWQKFYLRLRSHPATGLHGHDVKTLK